MGDQLQNLISKPTPGQQTGEELLGTLALLGGSYLQGRPGWGGRAFGVPAQIAGEGLLNIGSQGGQNRDEIARNKELAGYLPKTPEGEMIGKMLMAGAPYDEAEGIAKLSFPETKEKIPPYWESPDGQQEVQSITQPGLGWHRYETKPGKQPTADVYSRAADELGIAVPWAQMTREQRAAVQQKVDANKLAGEKPAQINIGSPISPKDVIAGPGGNPVVPWKGPKGVELMPMPPGTPIGEISGGLVKSPTTLADGTKYLQENPKGDPDNAILTRAEASGRLFGKKGAVTMWKVEGRLVDPRTLPPTQLEALSARLKAKGLHPTPIPDYTLPDGTVRPWTP